MVQVAVPVASRVTGLGEGEQSAMAVAPLLNVTVPVGVPAEPLTVAVRVTA